MRSSQCGCLFLVLFRFHPGRLSPMNKNTVNLRCRRQQRPSIHPHQSQLNRRRRLRGHHDGAIDLILEDIPTFLSISSSYHDHRLAQSHHYGQMMPYQTYGRTYSEDLSICQWLDHTLLMCCEPVVLTMNRHLLNHRKRTTSRGIQPMGKQIACKTYLPVQSMSRQLYRIRVIDQ